MSCFCKDTVGALATKVARLAPTSDIADPDTTAPDTTDDAPTTQATDQIAKLARWVQTRIPQTPWQPDPAWLETPLPPAPLEPDAMATLIALAQARTLAQQLLGLDLTQPQPQRALQRVVATMNERVRDLPPTPDPVPWQDLAAQATALRQVEQAAAKKLFEVTPERRKSSEQPGGVPLQAWRPLYQQVRALAPLLAVATQLGADLANPAAPAAIGQSLRALRSVAVPPLAAPAEIARYTALAQALSSIAQALGTDPVEQGRAAVQQMVTQRQNQLLEQLEETDPPSLPASVANVVTPDVVRTLQAIDPRTLQAMTWRVPPAASLPVVTSALPAMAFLGTLTALGIDPVRTSPCGRACDAQAVLQNSAAPSGGNAPSTTAPTA